LKPVPGDKGNVLDVVEEQHPLKQGLKLFI